MTVQKQYVMQMSVVILFLGVLFPTLSTATESLIDLLPASDEIPAYAIEGKHLDGRWIAVLDGHNGSSSLIPINLRVSVPSCESGSASCEDFEKRVKLSWTPLGDASFFVRGLNLDSRKQVTSATLPNECSLTKIGDRCSLESGAKKFNLSVTGKPGASTAEAPQEFSIVLKFEGRSQVLWDLHRDAKFSWDDPHFSLEWAGDLDQDGKPDLLMTLTEKYSSLPSILFLSSKAASGELVGRVAEYRVED